MESFYLYWYLKTKVIISNIKSFKLTGQKNHVYFVYLKDGHTFSVLSVNMAYLLYNIKADPLP